VIIYPDNSMFTSQSFIIVILFLVILQLRERRVKPLGLMIMPVFMFFISTFLVDEVLFTSLLNFILIAGGFALGTIIGYVVASFMKVKLDKDGNVMMKGSVLAVGVWVLVIILKFYGEQILGSAHYIDFNVLTSMFIMMTLGAMISRRLIIYKRYREHKLMIKKAEE
jgi:membrane protein CcdC involved in cytochrome C biogenesis